MVSQRSLICFSRPIWDLLFEWDARWGARCAPASHTSSLAIWASVKILNSLECVCVSGLNDGVRWRTAWRAVALALLYLL